MDIPPTVERTWVAFTTTLLATAPAHASHPHRPLAATGTARIGDFVGAAAPRGHTLARQLVAPAARADPPAAAAAAAPGAPAAQGPRATSRTIYLNRRGVTLRPGRNDSRLQTSSVVRAPTALAPWDVDDVTWAETVACVRELYARFDVEITDRDPGDTPHLEAVFGGHPGDVGLPDQVAGVSPFATDCSTIEGSVVLTFTDVLPDVPRTVCEVMAQEIAHSYGLDHELLAADPMTYLDYAGDRAFQDQLAPCGEDVPRPCGIDAFVCSQQQSSVQMLASRLGRRGHGAPAAAETPTAPEPGLVGCQAATPGSAGGILAALALAVGRWRRRRRG